MIKTFSQAVKFLEDHIPTPAKKHPGELGLARMKYLIDLLGNPQLKYSTIHVGGTSGKGSTATIIASILSTKYKVGLHTSPHLMRINERIKIFSKQPSFWGAQRLQNRFWTSQNDISNQNFIDLVNYIRPSVEKVKKSKLGSPSYFEIVTAMAFLHFHLQKVDIAVIEVGMGGRYDATNVVKPLVAVLTNVGLDHTEILGDTVEKIAEDKVGIIKPGIEVVSGVRQASVIDILRSNVKCQMSNLSLLNRDFSYKIKEVSDEGSVFDYKGTKLFKNLKLKLLGEYQVENAALAIRVVELLNSHIAGSAARVSQGNASSRSPSARSPNGCALLGIPSLASPAMNEAKLRKGLQSAFIPGRLEMINKKPLVILDGAHNPDKMKALVQSIKTIFPKKKVTAIIAIKEDKNVKEMLSQLLKISNKVIFTKFHLKGDAGIINSYDPKLLLQTAQNINMPHRYGYSHGKVEGRRKEMRVVVNSMRVVEDPKKAIIKAMEMAYENELILVTGSLYLIGEMKKFLISEYSHSRKSGNPDAK